MSNGYCNIRGRGLKFCNGSIASLGKKLATMSEDSIDAWSGHLLAHYGLIGNCVVKEIEPDFTFESTVDWYESLNEEELKLILDAYQSTQAYQKTLPESEGSKKKELPT